MPRRPLPPKEIRLLAAVLLLAALALAGPFLPAPADHHAFADQQVRWGVPHALDVLSNVAFALAGVAVLAVTERAGPGRLSCAERTLLVLSGAGLLLTAAGSTWYHLAPNDASLVVDRSAMAVAFAGLLGVAACKVTGRAALALAGVVLLAGPWAAVQAGATGDLWPWAVVQGGGLVLLCALASFRREAALPVAWWGVLAAYGVAKVFELGDHLVWAASHGWVSGHAIKHVLAAAAVLPLLHAVRRVGTRGQNADQLPLSAA